MVRVLLALAVLATAPAAALRLAARAPVGRGGRTCPPPALCAESDRTPTLAERDAALREAAQQKEDERRAAQARVAAKYDEAGTALVTAAQSARFHRRMRGAAQATSSGPPEALPDGTLQRQEAEIAQLLWAEVQTVYPALGGLSCEELSTRYLALSEEERALDESTSALDGVSMMIGGGVNRKYERTAVEKAAQPSSGTSSGSAAELSSSALSQAAAPLVILIATTAAFLTFSGKACDSPEPGSAIARGCAAQEAARAGERPEDDISRYARLLREDTARKLEGAFPTK